MYRAIAVCLYGGIDISNILDSIEQKWQHRFMSTHALLLLDVKKRRLIISEIRHDEFYSKMQSRTPD